MKGKIEVRFGLPFVNRLRSRVKNPSKDLSKDIRTALVEAVAETLNENTFAIRTKLIKAVADMGLEFKSKPHEMQVMSAVNNIFDSVFATSAEKLDEILGADEPADQPEIEDDAPVAAEPDEFED